MVKGYHTTVNKTTVKRRFYLRRIHPIVGTSDKRGIRKQSKQATSKRYAP